MVPRKGHRAAKVQPDTMRPERVRKDMVARSVDRNKLAVTHSFRDSKGYARVTVSIVVTTRVPIFSLSLKETRLEAF